MPSLRLIAPLASAAAALSLALAGALSPGAEARAPKGPAPALKLSSKVCNIGPSADDRFVSFDVAAGPGTGGDSRPAFRVRVQQRATVKAKWTKVSTVPSSTEVDGWEIATKPDAIVAATKDIGKLAEGQLYRVLVDVRGYSAAGKPTTKMATRTISCTQPLFTATLRLSKVTQAAGSGGAVDITTSVRNAGRLAAAEGTVTVFDAATRETLGTGAVDALKGGARTDVTVSIPACTGKLYVKVQPKGADPAELQPEQYTTVDCNATQARKRQRG